MLMPTCRDRLSGGKFMRPANGWGQGLWSLESPEAQVKTSQASRDIEGAVMTSGDGSWWYLAWYEPSDNNDQ